MRESGGVPVAPRLYKSQMQSSGSSAPRSLGMRVCWAVGGSWGGRCHAVRCCSNVKGAAINWLLSLLCGGGRETFFCVILTAGLGSKSGSDRGSHYDSMPGKCQHPGVCDRGLDVQLPKVSECFPAAVRQAKSCVKTQDVVVVVTERPDTQTEWAVGSEGPKPFLLRSCG